ncbi:hypothetical protein [Kitasatospora phosalacinea]|uniref:PhpD n=1 Tax=Kitasatospora phosalacinea TaxID=2065 RepID=A0A0M3WRJ0_9ACTN|nr:hypothetical protein [Kitasatospora phosalacinea]AKO69604.1 PhpD [Kitasatospora phosalacinea]
MRIDPFKLAHWMNARKYTPAQTAELAGLPADTLRGLLERQETGGEAELAAVAAALRLDPGQLAATGARDLAVVHQSAEAMHATRRPIQRDGIHFYNYYGLAAPEGRVAPVVLDILCPPERIPALNNGHLEPAITVNLGPGDINGRWGAELGPDTWQVLRANTGPDRWITGDSYVEPSYCPHSYSLAGTRPARIVSYTGESPLAGLLAEADDWPAAAFERAVREVDGLAPGPLLDLLLTRRLHTRATAARAAGLTERRLAEAVEEPDSPQAPAVLRMLGRALGFDYRVLLPPERRLDPVGKTWATLDQARRGIRRFGPYTVASMACAPHLPDLTGAFLRIDHEADAPGAELADHGQSHYLVLEGELNLSWDEPGGPRSVKCATDDSVWVGPFTAHRWSGRGSVLKFGSGTHPGSQDWLELGNTHEPSATLRRSRHDLAGWGYED